MVLRALHLCSGFGGFELGLRLAGVRARTVAHVERDSYAAATLVARMEEAHLDPAPVWSDIDTFDARPWCGRVDLITAGFPCQPFSMAGQQRGVDDDRWLWPSIRRLIRDVGPAFVFLENVPQLVRLGLPHVLADLAEFGFDAEWGLLSASAVGAPHPRNRFWLVGYAHEPEVARRSSGDESADAREDVADSEGARRAISRGGALAAEPQFTGPSDDRRWPPNRDDHGAWRGWTAAGGPEPALRRGADGPPSGLAESLHLGGNGLVPAVAAAALLVLADRAGIDLEG